MLFGIVPESRSSWPGFRNIRHIAFAVEDIDAIVGELERYKNSYRLCYVRGPEGIIVELAEQIG